MANSIYQKLAFATVGAVLGLAVMETPSVQAAIITYDFTVTIGSSPGNSYNGFFSYNDSEPSGLAGTLFFPYFAPSDFSFEFLGKTYTENNIRYATRYSLFPPVSYLTFTNPKAVIDENLRRAYYIPGGELDQVQFYLTDFSTVGIGSYFINFYPNSTFSFWLFDRFPQNSISQGGGTVTYSLRTTPTPPPTSVPEPGTVFGLSMLGMGWLLRKKKVSSNT